MWVDILTGRYDERNNKTVARSTAQNPSHTKHRDHETKIMSVSDRISQLEKELSRVTELLGSERDARRAIERQRAQDTLRRSEKLYQMIIQHAAVGIGLWNVNGRLISMNDIAAHQLGGDPDQFIGRTAEQLFGPAGKDYDRRIQSVIKSGKSLEWEDSVALDTGERWLLHTCSPVHGGDGVTLGAQMIWVDITERKRLEQTIRAKEAELQKVLDVSPGIICNANVKAGRVTRCNAAVTAVLGYTPQEFTGSIFMDLIHPDDRERTAATIRDQLQGSAIVSFENRYRSKNGSFKWLSWQATAADDEGNVQAAATDVTERKLADRKLRVTEELLLDQQAALFELATPECILSGDFDATLHRATELAANLLDVERVSVWELNEAATSLLSSDLYEASRNRHSNSRRRDIMECPMYIEALSNSPVVVTSNPREDSRTSVYWQTDLEPLGITSMLDAVIRADGRPAGVLCIHHVGQKREWILADLNFVRRLADLLGRAMEQRDRADDRRSLEEAFETINTLRMRVEDENIYLRERADSEWALDEPIGNSSAWMRVMRRCMQVAQTDAGVLLLGETGTGKDTVAQTIHNRSGRRDSPLVHVSCATLSASLIESELFGHERGAFTGAIEKRLGRFEIANGGTLFLDEVGELPGELQVKLLRVLEHGEFERVGSTHTQRVNVRLIAATNRDLEQDVADGCFRQDLYYRIGVFPIWLPPLRDRLEDIPLLAWYFLNKMRNKLAKPIELISQDALDKLKSYHWPGNVRELENVIERAMILSTGSVLTVEDNMLVGGAKQPHEKAAPKQLDHVQRAHIVSVLESCGWKIKGKGNAAELLDLKPSTLYARMKKLGIKRPAARTRH